MYDCDDSSTPLFNSRRLRSTSLIQSIPEPLPLFDFSDNIDTIQKPKTFSGDKIDYVEHIESERIEGGLLHDVFTVFGLARYLTNHISIIQSAPSTLVYQSKYAEGNTSLTEQHFLQESHVEFSSLFESGNLDSAYAVTRRDYSFLPPRLTFPPAHLEYDLRLRNDYNSIGNTQWYYFRLSNKTCQNFPLIIRLNIVNMRKGKSLYSLGKRPCIYRCNQCIQGWNNLGDNICYYKNDTAYTLTFTLTINSIDDVYLASQYPYTYTNLYKYLINLEKNPRVQQVMRRRQFCETLGGNRCDLITISTASSKTSYYVNKKKPAIVISARVHPGESQSSYALEGLIDYLTSDVNEVRLLLEMFTFKIIPMLNPDGVINGNYRCSLAGCDLNRRFLDANEELHPTIIALKTLLFTMHRTRGVAMYLDLHGHSAKKSTFIYGCDFTQEERRGNKNALAGQDERDSDSRRLFCRLFPKVLSKVSADFSYRDCRYGIQLSKRGTGRVSAWKSIGISASYTVEISFCGNGDNDEAALLNYLDGEAYFNDNRSSSIRPRLRGKLRDASNETIQQRVHVLTAYYQTARHYSQYDLRRIGADIGRSLFQYANLSHLLDSPTYQRYRAKDESGLLFGSTRSFRAFGHLSDDVNDVIVSELTADDILVPILAPAVFSLSALCAAMSNASAPQLRSSCEVSLRKELKIGLDVLMAELKSETIDGDCGTVESDSDNDCAFEEEEEGSVGSDSDPSADEISVDELIRKGKLNNLLKSDSQLHCIVKMPSKPRSKSAAKKSRRPSSASLVKQSYAAPRQQSATNASKFIVPVVPSGWRIQADTPAKSKPLGIVPITVSARAGKPNAKTQTYEKTPQRLRNLYDSLNFSKATESSIKRFSPESFFVAPKNTAEAVLGPTHVSTAPTRKQSRFQLKERGIFFHG